MLCTLFVTGKSKEELERSVLHISETANLLVEFDKINESNKKIKTVRLAPGMFQVSSDEVPLVVSSPVDIIGSGLGKTLVKGSFFIQATGASLQNFTITDTKIPIVIGPKVESWTIVNMEMGMGRRPNDGLSPRLPIAMQYKNVEQSKPVVVEEIESSSVAMAAASSSSSLSPPLPLQQQSEFNLPPTSTVTIVEDVDLDVDVKKNNVESLSQHKSGFSSISARNSIVPVSSLSSQPQHVVQPVQSPPPINPEFLKFINSSSSNSSPSASSSSSARTGMSPETPKVNQMMNGNIERKAERKAETPAFHIAKEDETPRSISSMYGIDGRELLKNCKEQFGHVTSGSRFKEGTEINLKTIGSKRKAPTSHRIGVGDTVSFKINISRRVKEKKMNGTIVKIHSGPMNKVVWHDHNGLVDKKYTPGNYPNCELSEVDNNTVPGSGSEEDEKETNDVKDEGGEDAEEDDEDEDMFDSVPAEISLAVGTHVSVIYGHEVITTSFEEEDTKPKIIEDGEIYQVIPNDRKDLYYQIEYLRSQDKQMWYVWLKQEKIELRTKRRHLA